MFEFVETPSNTPLLYKDDDIEVKVVKTLDATKQQNKDTSWCSTNKSGFYSHNKTANMYRINFKDGYKLRLTWDYINQGASELGHFSGGTHWGQGGVVDGIKLSYDVFRPRENDDPFFIDWQSEKEREIVNRIQSLPKEAVDAMKEYQNKMTIEKSANLNKLYSEIQKIKVVDVKVGKSHFYESVMSIKVDYNGETYDLNITDDYGRDRITIIPNGDYCQFIKDFKNKYAEYDKSLGVYLYDKSKEFLKRNSNATNETISQAESNFYNEILDDIDDILISFKDSGFDIKYWREGLTGSLMLRIESKLNSTHLKLTEEMIDDLNRLVDIFKQNDFSITESYTWKYTQTDDGYTGIKKYNMVLNNDHLLLKDVGHTTGPQDKEDDKCVYSGDDIFTIAMRFSNIEVSYIYSEYQFRKHKRRY